jgi:endoglucanase
LKGPTQAPSNLKKEKEPEMKIQPLKSLKTVAILGLSLMTFTRCGGSSAPSTTESPTSATSINSAPTTAPTQGWLSTSGNHIIRTDATVWVGRGANLQDTRSCGAGTSATGEPLVDNATGVNEVKRRIDILTGEWKANFIRLTLESRRTEDNYLNDQNYRSLVKEIVDYIGTKPGVYVLVSIWSDLSLDKNGWPTDDTNAILDQLTRDFYNDSFVMFGVSNEPENNYDGAQDAQVWLRMNSAVSTIRSAEANLGSNRHIITVQGTRDWARDLSYYVTHPITAGGGVNIAYETHVYNAPSDYDSLFVTPGKALPVIIGEFGPINDPFHKASVADVQTLMGQATTNQIPYLAWTFHQSCSPNLIGGQPGMTWDQNTVSDGLGIALYPTDFGTALKDDLQKNAQ